MNCKHVEMHKWGKNVMDLNDFGFFSNFRSSRPRCLVQHMDDVDRMPLG